MAEAAQAPGGYKALEAIGRGGMATVYRGVQVSLNRPVAIKVLSRRLAADPEIRERFQRESLIVARLTHPNIIHVIDRGVTGSGQPYFVMEYVEGTDLGDLARREIDFHRKLDWMIQVCKALAYAHRNGVVHRDIKPANIRIDREGNARVLDFGIAQFLEDGAGGERTRSGAVMGTYAYMAPEQLQDARSATAASDLYSLGAVLYELFTGCRPAGVMKRPAELNPRLPTELEQVIVDCLDPDPARRPPSAEAVKDRLLQLLQGAHLAQSQRDRAPTGVEGVAERFSLLAVIQESPHGAVYLYENRQDHSLLVIKRRPGTASGYTEARLLTALRHDHIVRVLGASGDRKAFIVVMEYLSGGSLRDRLLVPLPWGEVLGIARQMASALEFAHRNRIVHGNLRPSNVLFTAEGVVKLTDFGLDEHYGAGGAQSNWYAVPGEPRSFPADVFAAGVIWYRMLTGALPAWTGEDLEPHHLFGRIPEGFQALIAAMAARDPQRRPSGFPEIARALDELIATHLAPAAEASAGESTVLEAPRTAVGEEPERTSPRRGIPRIRLGLELAALAVAAGAFAYLRPEELSRWIEAAAGGWTQLGAWFREIGGRVGELLPR
ncbi:MAG: hypothetical protein Kow0092_29060 [Deferrisomatales bacterium]